MKFHAPLKLERAGTLQALRLEENPPAGELVQHVRAQQRRAHGLALKPLRSLKNIAEFWHFLICSAWKSGLHDLERGLADYHIRIISYPKPEG
jgi:hypothetical protein